MRLKPHLCRETAFVPMDKNVLSLDIYDHVLESFSYSWGERSDLLRAQWAVLGLLL
jgi:hypothetical protein